MSSMNNLKPSSAPSQTSRACPVTIFPRKSSALAYPAGWPSCQVVTRPTLGVCRIITVMQACAEGGERGRRSATREDGIRERTAERSNARSGKALHTTSPPGSHDSGRSRHGRRFEQITDELSTSGLAATRPPGAAFTRVVPEAVFPVIPAVAGVVRPHLGGVAFPDLTVAEWAA